MSCTWNYITLPVNLSLYRLLYVKQCVDLGRVAVCPKLSSWVSDENKKSVGNGEDPQSSLLTAVRQAIMNCCAGFLSHMHRDQCCNNRKDISNTIATEDNKIHYRDTSSTSHKIHSVHYSQCLIVLLLSLSQLRFSLTRVPFQTAVTLKWTITITTYHSQRVRLTWGLCVNL